MASNYVNNFDQALEPSSGVGLFLYGRPCSFKTFLATYVLKCLLVKGYACSYWTLYTLMTEARTSELPLEDLVGFTDNCIVLDNVNRQYSGADGSNWQINFLRRVLRSCDARARSAST